MVVSADGKSIRSYQPLRDVKCTIYADNFQPTADLAALAKLFSLFGQVATVTPCTHVRTAPAKLTRTLKLIGLFDILLLQCIHDISTALLHFTS